MPLVFHYNGLTEACWEIYKDISFLFNKRNNRVSLMLIKTRNFKFLYALSYDAIYLCFRRSLLWRERVPNSGTLAVIGSTIGMECVADVSSL